MGHRWLVLACALLGACKVAGTFDCALDEQCGAGGACQPSGYCSFADATCPSGQRYDDYAGSGLAGQCFDPFAPDAPAIDAAFDGPPGIDATPPIDAFPPVIVRINVGGGAYTGVDYPGMWAGDPTGATCPGGTQYTSGGTFDTTVDDALFAGLSYRVPDLHCAVAPLPAGTYAVQLLFAEIYYGCSGGPAQAHVMTVQLEATVIGNVDSELDGGGCATNGAGGHPYAAQGEVEVTDGTLDITITGQGVQSGVMHAVEVIRVQ